MRILRSVMAVGVAAVATLFAFPAPLRAQHSAVGVVEITATVVARTRTDLTPVGTVEVTVSGGTARVRQRFQVQSGGEPGSVEVALSGDLPGVTLSVDCGARARCPLPRWTTSEWPLLVTLTGLSSAEEAEARSDGARFAQHLSYRVIRDGTGR